MALFGQNLRQARQARNITLQEIAATTKVSSRALQALEDEHFELLPGGVFNKGFVRAYARCVGLDEEKTDSRISGGGQGGTPGNRYAGAVHPGCCRAPRGTAAIGGRARQQWQASLP